MTVFIRLLVSLEKTSDNCKPVANEQEKYSNIDKMQMFHRENKHSTETVISRGQSS